ncbi:transglycosylase domain-containing protein [Phocaeicola sartorii]|uniref:transglycosylase domain-containing protein n=1 Tax=Phocaeicola sartorii TaxID=671267 RepID=UPI0026704F7A|nr:transglycosylase domain-containing protein [Phocaeicola sartorii]
MWKWGPFIYSAREASRFYFDKEPSRLTTKEAIFLASIFRSRNISVLPLILTEASK